MTWSREQPSLVSLATRGCACAESAVRASPRQRQSSIRDLIMVAIVSRIVDRK